MEQSVSQYTHEQDMARMERMNKRLFILALVLVILLVGSNIGWLIYESQYQVMQSTVEQEVDTGEGNATVIGIGNYNGESETDSNNTEESP